MFLPFDPRHVLPILASMSQQFAPCQAYDPVVFATVPADMLPSSGW